MSAKKGPPKIYRVPRDMLWLAIQRLTEEEFCALDLVPSFPLARLSALSSGLTAFGATGRLQRTGKRTLYSYGKPIIWFRINPDYLPDDDAGVARDKPFDHDPEKLLASLMGARTYEDFIPARMRKLQSCNSKQFCS